MKYFACGTILFILYIINLELIPKVIPSWWPLSQGVFALLFFIFGIQTMLFEKKTLAGVVFILLGLVTFLILLVVSGISGIKG